MSDGETYLFLDEVQEIKDWEDIFPSGFLPCPSVNIKIKLSTKKNKAVPNVVGVDIGCGMYTVNLGKVNINFEKVDEAAHFIPSGMNVWEGRQERFDLTGLACYRELKDTKRLERSLGTLGGGL